MFLVQLTAAAALGAMIAVVGAGLSAGGLTDEGGQMLDLLWGRITLVDIYLAFLIGWVWIAWRERSAVRAGAWLVATIVLGSLTLWAYVLGAALRSADISELLIGPRHARPSPAPEAR